MKTMTLYRITNDFDLTKTDQYFPSLEEAIEAWKGVESGAFYRETVKAPTSRRELCELLNGGTNVLSDNCLAERTEETEIKP